METQFKIGDRVKVIEDTNYGALKGDIGTVVFVNMGSAHVKFEKMSATYRSCIGNNTIAISCSELKLACNPKPKVLKFKDVPYGTIWHHPDDNCLYMKMPSRTSGETPVPHESYSVNRKSGSVGIYATWTSTGADCIPVDRDFNDIMIEVEPEKPKETVVYKALIQKPNGQLVSFLAGGGYYSGTIANCPEITYRMNQIISAPGSSKGIFVKLSLAEAIGFTETDREKITAIGGSVAVVYKAIAHGDRILDGGYEIGDEQPRFRSIKLVEEVWREETVRPEPKFKVGDRVLVARYSIDIGLIGVVEKVKWAGGAHEHYHYTIEGAKYGVKDESWLEPAPKEPEWKDVTGECTLKLTKMLDRIGNYIVEVHHGAYARIILGKQATKWVILEGTAPRIDEQDKSYKVEFSDSASDYFGFKILKRVS
jgi:hypothetical protein